jgi:Beta-propeller repeat
MRFARTNWGFLRAAKLGEMPGRIGWGGSAMKIQGAIGAWGGRVWEIAGGAIVVLMCVVMIPRATNRPAPPAPQTKNAPTAQREILASYGKLPLVFEKNLGQTSPRVKYLAHASGYTLFLTDKEAVLRLEAPATGASNAARRLTRRADVAAEKRKFAVVSLSLDGSQAPAHVEALDAQPGHTNYLIGRDRSRWQKNVPMYGRVKYHSVYPGVDAVYYGNENRLETDYIVAPGSDPNQIVMDVQGAKTLKINSLGDVALTTEAGDLILRRPNVYQEIGGARREIAANYIEHSKSSIGIQIGAYDSREPLVVDPVLDYSTFLGGSGGEAGNAIAVDASGDAYVCGSTSSSNFPVTTGVYLGSNPDNGTNGTSAFIAELNPTGTQLIFATYLGGSVSESCQGIGVDSSGNVYVTGTTRSLDFPTLANAILLQFPPGNLGTTGFFSELNSTGTALTYSTFLGGNYRDNPAGVALDSSRNIYIAGSTASTNFPTTANAFLTSSNSNNNANGGAGFLTKINLTMTPQLQYSTYMGGSDSDGASAVAVDSVGNAYITGTAASADFPVTSNAFQAFNGGFDNAFVSRFDTSGQTSGFSSLIYSSYLGGSTANGGAGNAIAVDSNFNAYIGGGTAVADFPTTTGAFMTQQPVAAYIMGFVAKFNTSPSVLNPSQSLVYSTYLGGSNVSGNYVFGIAVDPLGDAYVAGSTYTNNYPTTLGAPQPFQDGVSNAILTVFNPAGSALLFSTYFGGNTNDVANAIALDSAATPNAYITGTVHSANFPFTPGVFQTQLDGLTDAFVAKMSPAAAQGVFATPTTLGFGNQGTGTTSTAQTVVLTNNTSTALSNIAITFAGSNPADFPQSNTCPIPPATLAAFTACNINVTFTPANSGAESATMNIADSDASSPQTVALTGTGTAVAIAPSSLSFRNQTQNTASAAQTVTLTNNGANSLTGITISVTGSNPSDFGETNTCGTSLATLTAGANCTISVIFTPTTQAAESATLNIADSDPSSPQLVTLTGTGTKPLSGITVSPSSLAFGNQSENTASASQAVTLTNGGTASLTGISLSFTGTNAGDFTQTNTCGTSPATLAVGASCAINVAFTPTTQTAETASLSIADSDPSSPQLVPLTGTGTAPVTAFIVSLSPASATINAGDTINVVATVTSENAFNSAVGFTFAGTPGDASIVASPNTVTPPANGSITSTITIVTDLKAASLHPPFSFPFGSQHPLKMWTFMGLLLALFGIWTVRQRSAKRLAGAFAMILLIGLVSCTGTPSTPKGTYQVRISGVAGNQNFPATFTLTVK